MVSRQDTKLQVQIGVEQRVADGKRGAKSTVKYSRSGKWFSNKYRVYGRSTLPVPWPACR